MKIAMITHNYPPNVNGGGEISCKLLVEALKKRGHTVDVLIGSELFANPSASLNSLHRMYDLLKENKDNYDIFHIYNMDYLPIVGKITKKYNIKSVATLNGIKYSNAMVDKDKKNIFRTFRNKYFINHCIRHISHFTTLCPMYRNMWELDGISFEKISVIPNMIDPMFKVEKEKHKQFNVLFVGNKAWWRDKETVERVAKINDDVRVIAVGKGWSFSNKIENFSCSNEEIKNIYAIADVLIAPYKLPLPISRCILEAMQTGIPVITTGDDRWSPVIEDNKSGILETNAFFPRKVDDLKTNNVYYHTISKQAKDRVNDVCHPDNISKEYIKIYEEVMK